MEAYTLDQCSLSQVGVKRGGVERQCGRDQKSLCPDNLQLDNAGCRPANQGWAGEFTKVFQGSHGGI